MNEQNLAGALGWFSIGLGLAEVVAARSLGRYLGVENRSGLLRLFGVREIVTGVGIPLGSLYQLVDHRRFGLP